MAAMWVQKVLALCLSVHSTSIFALPNPDQFGCDASSALQACPQMSIKQGLSLLQTITKSQASKRRSSRRRHVTSTSGLPALPIVISVPHDGDLKDSVIPKRQNGTGDGTQCKFSVCSTPMRRRSKGCGAKTARDTYSGTVAQLVYLNLVKLTGRRPYLVKMNLHRSKLDMNREICEAAQGSKVAKDAWEAYIEKASEFRNSVNAEWGRGVFFDFHGFKEPGEVQLGYGLTRTDLEDNAGIEADSKKVFVRNLARNTNANLEDLIRGPRSLGTLLTRAYPTNPSCPSEQVKFSKKDTYFSGGYLSQRFGSKDTGTIDSIQVELTSTIRRNLQTSTDREVFAAAFSNELLDWMQDWYGSEFAFGGWTRIKKNAWCSKDLRKDLREESSGTTLSECKALALADPDCGNQIYANRKGGRCRCVRPGRVCDFIKSNTNDVYGYGGVNAAYGLGSAYGGWTRIKKNAWCSKSLRKDLREQSSGTTLAECKALALADPDCGNQIYANRNGGRCRCVRPGNICDFIKSATNDVYAYGGLNGAFAPK